MTHRATAAILILITNLSQALSARGQQKPVAPAKPFTQGQVQAMVPDGFGDDSDAKLIEQRGIDFAPSEDFCQTFKAASAAAPHTAGRMTAESESSLSRCTDGVHC